jgi:hypothetical protein
MNARGSWSWAAILLVACGPSSVVTPADRNAFQALHARLAGNGATHVSQERVADAEAEAARAEALGDAEEAHEAMALAVATLALADAESEHAVRTQARLRGAHNDAESALARTGAQAMKRDQEAAAETAAADRELLRDAAVPVAKAGATPVATRRELIRVLRAEAIRTCALGPKAPPTAPKPAAASDLAREVADAETARNTCIQALPSPSAPLASALREALPEALKPLARRDRRGLVVRGPLAALKGFVAPPQVPVVVAGKQARRAAATLGLTQAVVIEDDTLGETLEIAVLAADR